MTLTSDWISELAESENQYDEDGDESAWESRWDAINGIHGGKTMSKVENTCQLRDGIIIPEDPFYRVEDGVLVERTCEQVVAGPEGFPKELIIARGESFHPMRVCATKKLALTDEIAALICRIENSVICEHRELLVLQAASLIEQRQELERA